MRPTSGARWATLVSAASGRRSEEGLAQRSKVKGEAGLSFGNRKRPFRDNPKVAGIKSGPRNQKKAPTFDRFFRLYKISLHFGKRIIEVLLI